MKAGLWHILADALLAFEIADKRHHDAIDLLVVAAKPEDFDADRFDSAKRDAGNARTTREVASYALAAAVRSVLDGHEADKAALRALGICDVPFCDAPTVDALCDTHEKIASVPSGRNTNE